MDGARLKEIRKDNRDTQESLALKLGFSTPTISKWEQGLSEPNLDTLKRICNMYHVTSDYLLGLADIDPILYQRKHEKLSLESQNALRLFEDFLYQKERIDLDLAEEDSIEKG